MFFAACVTQDAVGCAVAPGIRIRRLACSITANTYSRAPDSVTVSGKSHASRAPAWERRKSAHVLEARSGAGLIPASWRISQTAEAATLISRTSSSPWMRRYPQPDCPGRAATPRAGWSARCAAFLSASAGRRQRDDVRPGPGASAAPCPDAPPTSLCVASLAAAGAATPPRTRDRSG
jgi:hypothetical protein